MTDEFEKPMTTAQLVEALTVAVKQVHDLQGELARLRGAFSAGIEYHDALMRMRRITGEGGIFAIDDGDELEQLFVDWHNAIAVALGVDP